MFPINISHKVMLWLILSQISASKLFTLTLVAGFDGKGRNFGDMNIEPTCNGGKRSSTIEIRIESGCLLKKDSRDYPLVSVSFCAIIYTFHLKVFVI